MAKFYFKLFIAGLFIIVAQLGNSQSGRNVNGWFDAAEFLYNNSNANPNTDIDFYTLQFDSGYYWLDDSGAAQPFNTFAAGHIFDVKHELWSAVPYPPANPIFPVLARDPFVWDSLRFNYFYLRGNPDTSVTDTLFIYYYCNFDNSDTQIDTYIYVFGTTDSVRMATPQPFNYKELSGKYFRKDTILLKPTDSAGVTSRRLYKTSVNRSFNGSLQTNINHANLFGFSVAFKPGSVNVSGDTLFDKRNNSATANVFGVYYIRVPEPGPFGWNPVLFITKIFAENSLWLYKDQRYGVPLDGRFGFTPGIRLYAPLYFHGAAFVTGKSTVSTKEVNAPNFKLWPNPASAGKTFTIEGDEQLTGSATVTITDMLGRCVYSEMVIPTGLSNYSIISPSAEGIYTVTITNAGNSGIVYTTRLFVAR
ncbi:MAG TPA: T9SS type A sorting domain-containing protein [Bacteroidia bacterium]|nr:T9SS type A sorting domain-containing protein [Bacteroidia bacterium]